MDSETRDLLKYARADARESYYRLSAARTKIIAMLVMLSLVLAAVGVFVEKPIGYVLILGGIFGMVTAAVWSTYRT